VATATDQIVYLAIGAFPQRKFQENRSISEEMPRWRATK